MAHDPTRHWPLGVGPENTSIPGAAWLELLDGQAFPVVGAGAMVWNGTMWVPVSDQNRLPVEATLSGRILPPPIIRINSDTVIPPGTNYDWALIASERDILDRWPIFAVIVGLKLGTSGTYNLNVWQYLPNHENESSPIPPENYQLDPWTNPVTNRRIFVARVRRFPTARTRVRVQNVGSSDIVVSNLLLQCLEV